MVRVVFAFCVIVVSALAIGKSSNHFILSTNPIKNLMKLLIETFSLKFVTLLKIYTSVSEKRSDRSA